MLNATLKLKLTQNFFTIILNKKPIMKTKTRAAAFIVCLSALLTQFSSCKKEDISSNAVTASSTDLIVAKTNLVAWYKFTKGNTADFSGNNNHLTAFNTTLASDYLGRPNNAYFFDGQTSYMMAPNSSSLNASNITLVALFKPMGFYTGNGTQSRIFMKGRDDQSNGHYFLGFHNTGEMYGTYGDNQFQYNGVGDPNYSLHLNNWYKLVYTYNGIIGKLYVNGVLVNTSDQVATFTPTSDPLTIGKMNRVDFPYWFTGVIDEIRIYNKALSATQVAKVNEELELGK